MKRFDYYQPESLKEAYAFMEKSRGNARYIAGGTDLIVKIKQKAVMPSALISLKGIRDLNGIRKKDDLTLGSMTLLRTIERDPLVEGASPVLKEAVGQLANPQIRNVATIGGNLCNAAPSADSAPPLMVMEAVVTIEGPGGKKRVPVEAFFKGPGESCMEPTEILTEITIPQKSSPTGMAFIKTGRVTQDLAVANAAALLVMDNRVCRKCRLVAGAVAPTPLRLRSVEAVVEGQEISPELLEEVCAMVKQEVHPITDVRATEGYRRIVSGVLVKRAVLKALERLG